MRIRDNSLSMFIQNQYTRTNNALSRVMKQLASGCRINSAADDPAGLAISEKMRAQIRGLNAAKRNVQTAVNLVQTAEGYMDSAHAILQRMGEIAVQAASDTNDSGIDRKALNQEFEQLKEELTDIFENAEFNGIRLFSGQYGRENGGLVIQSGPLEGHTTPVFLEEMSLQTLGLEAMNVFTRDRAAASITALRAAVNKVSAQRGNLGGMQNRLEFKIQNLENQAVNLSEAESRIRDVDIAQAMTEAARLFIQQQVILAVMAQCNTMAKNVLTLLSGL